MDPSIPPRVILTGQSQHQMRMDRTIGGRPARRGWGDRTAGPSFGWTETRLERPASYGAV
ncbi:hypothetical protein Vau01_105140 [Virgisporangium aurantiacum]|uniref:Uncharacterized protein n=1 Tax=Virgisporangium aurantiacum TaxID=175570 RepID=A0A8J4E6B7_9ACTN|nr:hypothetical protein Vau01_105140 [Virgisporangium aurantiacum]